MRVAVIGTGYVGLVAGVGLSELGNDVTVVGLDPGAVARLGAGEVDLYEPALEAMLRANQAEGRLDVSTDLEAAVARSEVVLLALPVAVGPDGVADLTELFAVADRIGRSIERYTVIATKTAVPVGTTDRLVVRIGAHGSTPFGVASNPSFLKEGDAVGGFMKPDRIVVGTHDPKAADVLRRLYAPFVRTRDRVLVVDPRSAELAKYAASALLATRISFMNEMALLADELGADIERVRLIMGADARIGPRYLFVGPGFGGRNFQNDIAMLRASAAEVGQTLGVVEATVATNQRQQHVLAQRLGRHLDLGSGSRVAIWGLSFKPRTSDIAEAPAMTLIEDLLDRGVSVCAHDPRAMPLVAGRFGDRIDLAEDMYESAEDADALVLVTEWHPYRAPDFVRLAGAMRGKLVIDGRNIWEAEAVRGAGLRYVGLGHR